MTCPYCDSPVDGTHKFCPNCGGALPAQPQAVSMPRLGKYRSGDDYLQLDRTCLTLFRYGLFRSSTRQISYTDIRDVTYRAAQGSTPGMLYIRVTGDEPDKADATTLRFGSAESPMFHELYTCLDAIARCNAGGITPVLEFAPEPVQAAPPRRPQSTAVCCPRCRCISIRVAKRGYRFGLGILGFFLLPVFGLALGFLGSGKLRCNCLKCGHRWTI